MFCLSCVVRAPALAPAPEVWHYWFRKCRRHVHELPATQFLGTINTMLSETANIHSTVVDMRKLLWASHLSETACFGRPMIGRIPLFPRGNRA